MAVKLTKEELEGPDAFQSTVELISDYIAENKKRFYSIVTAIVVAVIIALGIYIYWDNYQTSAREIYAQAQKNITPGAETPVMAQQQIKAYQELIAKYPHSWSARMAHYHLGNIYYNAGNYDNAINDYKKFVASRISDNAGIKFLALTSIGYCYEAKKDYKAALEYFEKAQKSNHVGFEAVSYSNIGRIYEQMNDKKKALENYKNALEKSTDPAKAVLIKYKISSLS
ncbi:MAG TPA: tetratricopeptide repeat protein [Smithella sp.]|nr:tetratricopeptide repeat protein [Smithella sp.]MDM7985729.1 tetratricopeptide repeat protein [Smithella sp.]HNY49084.1 tetratricopeptide repeat protein [Smithella sp.]HOG90396.1 tetratricopeptide repeat protein [Smithella sp.]HOU50483.1 tetratricopeptide repeat protein [Smithella sp.]